jgi:hypothetical protein
MAACGLYFKLRTQALGEQKHGLSAFAACLSHSFIAQKSRLM